MNKKLLTSSDKLKAIAHSQKTRDIISGVNHIIAESDKKFLEHDKIEEVKIETDMNCSKKIILNVIAKLNKEENSINKE